MPRSDTRNAIRLTAVAALALLSVLAGATAADDSSGPHVAVRPRAASRKSTPVANAIRLDINLVLIPVTVTDPLGAPVNGLPRQAFRLFEAGVEQQVNYFAAEDAPVSMGIVFDASRSMEGKLDQSRAAVARFFQTSTPGDEFFLVEFSDVPRMLCGFTSDTDRIERALVGIQPRNWTALLDAVYLGINHMKRARNPRKALLVLSDGGDNNSRYTEREMKTLVREADVCIYSIGLSGGLFNRHVRLLRNLSDETGGQLCEVNKTAELPDAVGRISAAIRRQYLLGYRPSKPENDGLYHKIEVRLNRPAGSPRLRVSWRQGYYAPSKW